MKRLLLALAVVFSAALAVVVGFDELGSGRNARPSPEGIVLRLPDLATGYRIGDDSFCRPLGVEGMPPSLADLIVRDHPESCYRQFERVPAGAAPGQLDLIESTAIVFSSSKTASEAFDQLDALLRFFVDLAGPAPSQLELGDQARTLLARELNSPDPATLVAWRSGSVVSYVRAGARVSADPLRYLQQIASLQQARVAHPVEPSPSDTDDRAVALDRTDLGVAVYWLGGVFPASGSLPKLTLADSRGPFAPGDGPGDRVQIGYDSSPGRTGVVLTIWQRAAWDSFLGSQLGDMATSQPCGQRR